MNFFLVFIILAGTLNYNTEINLFEKKSDDLMTILFYQQIEIEKDSFIYAEGSAVVLDKYPSLERNVLLARRGAILDAQRNLAEKIVGLLIIAETSSNNFELEEQVKSQVKANLKNIEIYKEYNNLQESKYYNVIIRIPIRTFKDLQGIKEK